MNANVSNIIIIAASALIAIGGFLLYQDSAEYNRSLNVAATTAKEFDIVRDNSGSSDSKWGIFGGKTVYRTEQANMVQKLAKEKYETERTKDFMVLGSGAALAIAGVVLRKRENA